MIARQLNRRAGSSGFTLAEVAVTLVIVSAALVLVLQGLNTSRATATYAHNRKLARELGLLTLGKVEAGLLWEELDGEPGVLTGTYAEEGHEQLFWELAVGDEDFLDLEPSESGYFDNYAWRRRLEEEYRYAEDEDEEGDLFGDTAGSASYERVRLRVTFPELTEQPNELVLERWIPREQVFGSVLVEEAEGGAEGGLP